MLVLEHDKGTLELQDDTLVFVLDETGHEDFKDENYQIFGLGGCGFMVRDYQRLIETPFNFMCQEFFQNIKRPFHTTDVIRSITSEQISSLNHLFEKFMFFRVARTMTVDLKNESEIDTIRLITVSTLEGIKEIAKWTNLNHLVIIIEDSDRIKNRILRGFDGYSLESSTKKITPDLCYMHKSSTFPALELADIIVHTAGRQTKIWKENGGPRTERDFNAVFKSIDNELTSFRQIQGVKT